MPIKLRIANRGYWLAGSDDVASEFLPASDLPHEALVVPTESQVEPLVLKRKVQNIEYDVDALKKRKLELEMALEAAPALIDKRQRELDEVNEELGGLEIEKKERDEGKGKGKGKGKELVEEKNEEKEDVEMEREEKEEGGET